MGWWFIPYVILVGPVQLTAFSLVMTRLYHDSGNSMGLMVLFHATISSSALVFGLTSHTPLDMIILIIPSTSMFVLAAVIATTTWKAWIRPISVSK
jgi:uncharacterized protein